jgi:hypothetical protein
METTIENQPLPSNAEFKAGTTKRRFKKLSGNDVAGLPGANGASAKANIPGIALYLSLIAPVQGLIGTVARATEVYEMAGSVDRVAKEKDVGEVINVNFLEGQAEIVIRLYAEGDAAALAVPIANAFTQLKDCFESTLILTQGLAGKRARWRAKANGTTIADGTF